MPSYNSTEDAARIFDPQTIALLKLLTEAYRQANMADSDASTMPSIICCNAARFIGDSIVSIINAHGYAMPDTVEYGAYGDTWYDDLVYELTHI